MDPNQGNNNPPSFDPNAVPPAPLGAEPVVAPSAAPAVPPASPSDPANLVPSSFPASPNFPDLSGAPGVGGNIGLPTAPVVPEGVAPLTQDPAPAASDFAPSDLNQGSLGPAPVASVNDLPLGSMDTPAADPGMPAAPTAPLGTDFNSLPPQDPSPVPFADPALGSPGASGQQGLPPVPDLGASNMFNTTPGGSMGGSPGSDLTGLEPQGVSSSTLPPFNPADLGGGEPVLGEIPAPEPMPTFTAPVADASAQLGSSPVALSEGGGIGSVDAGVSGAPSWASGGTDSAGTFGSVPEAVPTDLSHLVENPVTLPAGGVALTSDNPVSPPAPAPDVTVSGQSVGTEAAQAVTSGTSGGFPKKMIVIGAAVLVVVIAASAYFILGVGQQPTEQTSLPAVQAPLTNPPKVTMPSPTLLPPPPSTGSASFGNLDGATPPPSTGSASGGTSALDLLRQRQTQGR